MKLLKGTKNLATIKQDLLRATGITLRLPKPRQQHVILCNASYHGSGFILMVEDYVKENNSGEKKTYAPVSFGSRMFASPQLKFSVYYKEFFALYFALDRFAKYIWVNTKPVTILTDNRSLTKAKSMPSPFAFSWQRFGVQFCNRIYSGKGKLCGGFSFTKTDRPRSTISTSAYWKSTSYVNRNRIGSRNTRCAFKHNWEKCRCIQRGGRNWFGNGRKTDRNWTVRNVFGETKSWNRKAEIRDLI